MDKKKLFYNVYLAIGEENIAKIISKPTIEENDSVLSNRIEVPQDQKSLELAKKLKGKLDVFLNSLSDGKLLPYIEEDLNITITNILKEDRVRNYHVDDKGNMGIGVLPNTVGIDISLPVDIADMSLDVFRGEGSYIGGERRFYSFIPGQVNELKLSPEKVINSSIFTILTHELGHYYLNHISGVEDLKNELVKQSKPQELNKVKEWFSLLHEGFAESWAIKSTDFYSNDRLKIWSKNECIDNLQKTRSNDCMKNSKYDLSYVYSYLREMPSDSNNFSWSCLKVAYHNTNIVMKNILTNKIDAIIKDKFENFFGIRRYNKNHIESSASSLNKDEAIKNIDEVLRNCRTSSNLINIFKP